jgi:putative endonuclease
MSEKTQKQKIGRIGEDIATKFLVKHGYRVIEQNFLRKVGEIDIICEKDEFLYFVEVKTVSRENLHAESNDTYRPEDNIHQNKIERIHRTIQCYVEENENEERDWMLIVVTVELDQHNMTAKVRLLKDYAW